MAFYRKYCVALRRRFNTRHHINHEKFLFSAVGQPYILSIVYWWRFRRYFLQTQFVCRCFLIVSMPAREREREWECKFTRIKNWGSSQTDQWDYETIYRLFISIHGDEMFMVHLGGASVFRTSLSYIVHTN